MHLPNYTNGSIVNLMSSVVHALGGTSDYQPLVDFDLTPLRESKTVLILLLDGVGYDYLTTHGKNSVLYRHLRGKMTSVFPSTTAAAMTAYFTGVPPQQHGITGWFVHLKELGMVSTVLRWIPRFGGIPFSHKEVFPPQISVQQTVFERIQRESWLVTPLRIKNSDTTAASSKGAYRLGYNTLVGYLRQVKKALTANDQPKFIFAYWPVYDGLCHKHGTTSAEVTYHFNDLNEKLTAFLDSLKGTNTHVIITADHGMIDTDKAHTIDIRQHPEFQETLALPLCGEPRTAYCYVRPSKVDQFEQYVRYHFADVCDLHYGEDVIRQNWYGLGDPHPKLWERVGDYVLTMKDNYVMRDYLLGEDEYFLTGNHGGISSQEMYVPLITLQC
ncbi:MAG: hypothetical protein D6675_00040 [Gemmatimonadetes bacterium]|nr:MAG: hypothetical protein D6675_00040 [Gemmatimonadota bacterium]